MSALELKRLSLENFQGATLNEELPHNNNIHIKGENGAGKTRLMNAYLWLLTGRDSLGNADFEVKNIKPDGEHEHGLKHSVEAEFLVDGKEIIIFRKEYSEKWVKERGAVERVFSGHSTDYFVDGVPKKLSDYNNEVRSLFGKPDIFSLMSNPMAFIDMHWKNRRQLLVDLVGDVDINAVIEAYPKLEPVVNILGKHDIDDIISAKKLSLSGLNKELNDIPVEINALKMAMPDTPTTSLKEIYSRLEALDNHTDPTATIKKEISRISNRMVAIKDDITTQKEKLSYKIDSIKDKIMSSEGRAKENNYKMKILLKKLNALDVKTAEINESKYSSDGICWVCKQKFPDEFIAEGEKKFNREKAEELTLLHAQSEDILDEIENLKIFMKINTNEIQSLKNNLTQKGKELTELKDHTDNEKYIELEKRRIKLEDDMMAVMTAPNDDIISERKSLHDMMSVYKQIDNLAENIKKHKENERDIADKYQAVEGELALLELYQVESIRMLESAVNKLFKSVNFRMFRIQINKGIEQRCDITVNGVPAGKGLNHGATINGGLDICNVMQKKYGIKVPIWVDNAEALTSYEKTDTQMLWLEASPGHKQLTIT